MKTRAVALILVTVLLGACPKTEQPRSAPTPSASSSASASASPAPPRGDPSPERFLFESVQRPPATHSVQRFYMSDPISLRRQRLEFPSPLGRLVASPDGRRFARLSGRTLWTASTEAPTRFRRIATARGAGEAMMAQLVWDRDGSMLVYLTWRAVGPTNEPHRRFVNEIYTARFDGTMKHLVKRFSTPAQVVLRAYDAAKNRLFWFETGDGGYESNLTEIDTASGNVVRTYPELETELYTSFGVSPDLEKAYYATTVFVREFSFRTRTFRTYYRISRTKDEHSNESTILHSVVRPRDPRIIFSVHHEPSDKDITYSLDLRTGRRTAIFGKPRYYNLAVEDISPSGRYLWLKTFCLGCGEDHGYDNRGKYYILDTITGKLILAAEDSETEHVSIQLLCWLRV